MHCIGQKSSRKKEISLLEYYTELDKKVKEKNPELNALVEWRLDEQLEKIKAYSITADQPFAGIPIPLKMLGQEKAGWKSTFGSRLLSEHRASRTSTLRHDCESIGFIPVGQTNSPEFWV